MVAGFPTTSQRNRCRKESMRHTRISRCRPDRHVAASPAFATVAAVAAVAGGYLLGTFPSADVVSAITGVSIRTSGTGNPGTLNTAVVAGMVWRARGQRRRDLIRCGAGNVPCLRATRRRDRGRSRASNRRPCARESDRQRRLDECRCALVVAGLAESVGTKANGCPAA